ncbi:hypothetical protein LCGC14_0770160 [marine sediment metagenome]|uniref:DUF952 domain-containing protein n=1 Tax=marine sediment metagenome TaxID=412755 RepID=A0A0F9QID9_9ZZZZ
MYRARVPFIFKDDSTGQNDKDSRIVAARRSALDPSIIPRHHIVMLIYKIFRADEWHALRQNGSTPGAPIDITDGYVHFSTASQAAETAAKHFAHETDLFLLAIDSDRLGDALKWEISRGNAKFPHLYRELTMPDIAWAQPLPLVNGTHEFPAGFEGEQE